MIHLYPVFWDTKEFSRRDFNPRFEKNSSKKNSFHGFLLPLNLPP